MNTVERLGAEAERTWLERWTAGPVEREGAGLPRGAAAPDVVLPDETGASRHLSEFWGGQPALLLFWRHFGCECGAERARRLVAEQVAYRDAGLTTVIIAQGSPARAAAYRDRHGLPCPVLSDDDLTAYQAYGLGQWSVERVLYDAPDAFLQPACPTCTSTARTPRSSRSHVRGQGESRKWYVGARRPAAVTMSVVHLRGRPRIEGRAGGYRMRSRKSWALLAYLLLSERPPTRSQLATLLFNETEDPLGALRWALAEIRKALGGDVVVEGDPVVLRLPVDTVVDVDVIIKGSWVDAVRLPGLGSELLEALTVKGAAAFESWLLAEQRRVMSASEEILHEAALASLSRGAFEDATGYAVRLVAMTPSDENHHALLIRLYRMTGDDAAAARQLRTCTELLARDLGTTPGPVVRAAMRESRSCRDVPAGLPSIEAVVESGKAAVSAGAIETGTDLLRTAVRLADHADAADLRVTARLSLAEALIHSMGGLDEEGMATLQGAADVALAHGNRALVAEARAELGYVDFLRARYDRAEVWLSHALEFADGAPLIAAKANTYLGAVDSDRGRYPSALSLLNRAVAQARAVGDFRRAAFALSMLGRVHLLRHDLDAASAHLDEAMRLSQQEHWLSFTPWPQSLLGEVELARGDNAAASVLLEQAFARACQLGDPCWEGMSARGLALVAAAQGDMLRAFRILADARVRANRLADPYVWLDGYILDTQCTLGRRYGHPDTPRWVQQLRRLASRTGMRELTVRSLLHGAAAGNPDDAKAAHLLAADIDNPLIDALVRDLERDQRPDPASPAGR